MGSRFESRAELSDVGLHRPLIAGISGSEREGADSIVLSGGYENDQDFGDEIIYTGPGGRDQETGKQIADQNFSRGNRALAYSSLTVFLYGSFGARTTIRHTLLTPDTATMGSL